MPLTDTSPAAKAIQLQILRAMPGEKRLLIVHEMSMFAGELAAAGVRRDHPQWTEAQIACELLRLAFLPDPLPSWLPALASD
jgi:hypothetical protein